jgi:uncharacterized protein
VLRIGLLADTHCGTGAALADAVLERLAGVSVILHAGDITSPEVLRRLERVAPVIAVRGNCDAVRLPRVTTFVAGTVRIGLMHEPPRSRSPEALFDLFGEEVQCVVHGHTHRSLVDDADGILVVNPGSCRLPRDGWHSVGVLEVDEGVRAHILHLAPARRGD